LHGLTPVGWFHSHTRSDIAVFEEDVALHNRFFPEPHQFALVLKPEKFAPTQGGFFFRDTGGQFTAQTPPQKFIIGARRQQQPEAGFNGAPTPLPPETEQPKAAAQVPFAHHELPPDPPPRRVRRRLLSDVVLCLLVALAAAGYMAWRSWPTKQVSAPRIPLNLHVNPSGDAVSIEWNPRAPEVAGVTGGDLEIRDGEASPQYVPLTVDDLRGGRIAYVAGSRHVRVRLRLHAPDSSLRDYVATYVAAEPLVSDVTVQADEAARPAPETAESKPAVPAAEPLRPEPLPEQVRTRVVRSMTLPQRAAARAQVQLPGAPPSIQVEPSIGSAPAVGSGPRITTPAPAPAPPPKVEVKRRAPSSGRAIWTGELKPGVVLSIEGGKAAFGAISGRLPQGPAKVRAQAAELGEAAIVIYTGDESYRYRSGAFESPSAKNGWNLTTYRFDPKRAAAMAVIESPGPQNQWKTLRVRAGGRKVTVIVLDWEETSVEPR
jgi:hypothetical protein